MMSENVVKEMRIWAQFLEVFVLDTFNDSFMKFLEKSSRAKLSLVYPSWKFRTMPWYDFKLVNKKI